MSGPDTPVISQIGYPGAGDIDDCWCVATIWAAVASRPAIRRPTVTEFRRHAGDPDDGIRDGGSLDEVMAGARGSWPTLDVTRWQSSKWDGFAALVKAGRPASLALDSRILPVAHQYGFRGKHQVGVAWDPERRTFVVANPLAKDGTAPKPISEAALRRAAEALLPGTDEIRAALFPQPVALPDTSTEDIVYSIPESDGPYPATVKAGTQLFGSPTDTTANATVNDPSRPYMVVGSGKATDTATTGRRALHGRYSGKPVALGWVDVGRLVR